MAFLNKEPIENALDSHTTIKQEILESFQSSFLGEVTSKNLNIYKRYGCDAVKTVKYDDKTNELHVGFSDKLLQFPLQDI